MRFSRDYRRPFWKGFLHASLVVVYTLFMSLLITQMPYVFGTEIGQVIQVMFGLFLTILSVAICAWLIFYEPMKKLMHFHFKAATTMLLSTIGWLFVYMIVFIFGLLFSLV